MQHSIFSEKLGGILQSAPLPARPNFGGRLSAPLMAAEIQMQRRELKSQICLPPSRFH
jgi:hypothetical protein